VTYPIRALVTPRNEFSGRQNAQCH
jgi:hypothetical protein